MNRNKTSRPAGTGNGSKAQKLISIVSDRNLKNKVRNAIYHGTVLGAVLAVFGGVCYMDTSIAVGAVVSVLGLAWLGIFYLINTTDIIYRGWR